MTHAAIVGWGKCLPPSILTNQDLASFLPTDDAWITSRTGMKERRISHVPGIELAITAAHRAIACAGMRGADIELVIYGSCSNDETVPNSASGVQQRIGAGNAASFDVNTACTSFMYGLSIGSAMIKSGIVKNALIIGVELISQYMDWEDRDVAVLFGDGAAAMVLQASEQESGVIAEKLQCYADARHILRVRGMGTMYANLGVQFGITKWDFDGAEIFRKAVQGMSDASLDVMRRAGVTMDDIALVVPHQANLRIIDAVAKRAGAGPDKLFLTVQKYGNMSSATAPVALVEAVEEGRVPPGGLVLMPAFGGGLTLSAHLIRWGDRVKPLETSDADLVPCTKTALELVNEVRAQKKLGEAEAARFQTLSFAENRTGFRQ
ncbi:MAG: 3-oxoacyl-[acyl-carrier-protein] synthase [Gammaproteobacteria bacterium]|nr:3-oxoacyl-[acyl-carrier-protein] synthase [Gammaproteobacteria bacterium]